ncbi:LPXTG cell wall anchor domain-containing protein [Amycolatopsis sp. cmx-4-54]|uniref:LPXTG cell wall anchor domain-containing protein n=1 Tax=Amycolatopsis sp. cmx-4-54 TaxID=2790936 RepID=UPI00397B1700
MIRRRELGPPENPVDGALRPREDLAGVGATGLASTGADVIWLGALALAALGLGAGLVFGARRRFTA